MKELGSCSGGVSGEHLISEAIIRLLAGEGDFTVGGLPWIPPGEFKAIGPKSLTAIRFFSRLRRPTATRQLESFSPVRVETARSDCDPSMSMAD